MPTHDHTQLEQDISALKNDVAEIHGFLLGNRLHSNGKKGWLEQVEDRLSDIEGVVRWGRTAIMAAVGTLGVMVTTVGTLTATGTVKVVLRFLGVE